MHKALRFESLAALVDEFRSSYEDCYHKLLTVYVGLPLPHNPFLDQPVKWRATKVRVFANTAADVSSKIDKYAANMNKMNEHFLREGVLPGPTAVRSERG